MEVPSTAFIIISKSKLPTLNASTILGRLVPLRLIDVPTKANLPDCSLSYENTIFRIELALIPISSLMLFSVLHCNIFCSVSGFT